MLRFYEWAIQTYGKYSGDSLYLYLFGVCLLLLLFFALGGHKEDRVFLVGSILFIFVFICPYTAKVIMGHMIGRSVYWRMLWVLPYGIVIALAASRILLHLRSEILKLLALLVIISIIFFTGKPIYSNRGTFTKAENLHKLPEETIEVCKMIGKDAEKEGITYKKVLAPKPLLTSIRQYDSEIQLVYGRNVFKRENMTENQQKLESQMDSDQADAETMNAYLRKEACNYLVWDRPALTAEFIADYGYVLVGQLEDLYVFRIDE